MGIATGPSLDQQRRYLPGHWLHAAANGRGLSTRGAVTGVTDDGRT